MKSCIPIKLLALVYVALLQIQLLPLVFEMQDTPKYYNYLNIAVVKPIECVVPVLTQFKELWALHQL